MTSRKGTLSPLTVAFQDDAETVPTTGGFQVSHYSETLAATDGLSPDPAIEHGATNPRDQEDPADAIRRAGGGLELPFCFVQNTFWLAATLGLPTTTGESAPYTHVFKSGQSALKPFAMSAPHTAEHWKLGDYVIANTLGFSLNKEDGYKRLSIAALARDARLVKTEPGFSSASPTLMGTKKAAGSLATFGIDDTVVANITGGNFQYSNNAQLLDFVDGSDASADYDADDATVRTDLTLRLVEGSNKNAILDRMTGKPADAFDGFVELALSADWSLRIDMPRCIFERRQPQNSGRGMMSVSAGFNAYRSGSDPAATFTLKNNFAGFGA